MLVCPSVQRLSGASRSFLAELFDAPCADGKMLFAVFLHMFVPSPRCAAVQGFVMYRVPGTETLRRQPLIPCSAGLCDVPGADAHDQRSFLLHDGGHRCVFMFVGHMQVCCFMNVGMLEHIDAFVWGP